MTRMLASVQSAAEARQMLKIGADIIDCKNPADGALGALSLEDIASVVGTINGKCPVSATIGNIDSDFRTIREKIHLTVDRGVDYVKIGLFNLNMLSQQLRLFKELSEKHYLIAVCFADHPLPGDILPGLADSGVHGVMIDTADKNSGGLTQCWSYDEIRRFISEAHTLNLLTGLAGRLSIDDIAALTTCGADYLGFRSALCREGRDQNIDDLSALRVRQAFTHAHQQKTSTSAISATVN